MITKDRLEEIEELERQQRHARALASLEAIRAMAGDRNSDLSEEEAMDLAVEVTREVRQELWEARQRQAGI
jgi:hypothetical protein